MPWAVNILDVHTTRTVTNTHCILDIRLTHQSNSFSEEKDTIKVCILSTGWPDKVREKVTDAYTWCQFYIGISLYRFPHRIKIQFSQRCPTSV